jgi:hypothetical protein
MGLISSIMFRSARNALAKYNGVMTWNYAQSDWSTFSVIARDPVSRIGICKALSAQWIVDHAYGGSLVNRLTTPGGALDASAIRMVMQNFIGAWNNQDIETAKFLESRGMRQRCNSRMQDFTRTTRVGGQKVETTTTKYFSTTTYASGGGNCAIELAKALRTVSGSYVQIDFGGDGVGHATCAWIGGPSYGSSGDAAFFDPNCGEYWFERKADFCDWFQYFYEKSYAGFPCRFNSRWSVSQWGLAVGAEKSAYAKAVNSVAGRR